MLSSLLATAVSGPSDGSAPLTAVAQLYSSDDKTQTVGEIFVSCSFPKALLGIESLRVAKGRDAMCFYRNELGVVERAELGNVL